MVSLSKRDRSVLGGLIVAMIVGVGGSLALAASCLGRDQAHRESDPVSRFPEDQSARTSAGGVPGEEADEPVGTTRITAAELPPAGAAAATTNAPPADPNADMPPAPPISATNPEVPAPHTNTIEVTPRPAPGSTPPPAPVPATGAGAAGDGGAAAPPAPARPDGGAGATSGGDAGRSFAEMLVPTPYENIGAGNFISEPPRYGASSWEANHEAGAGPFTTERNVPDNPGP